MNWEIILAIFFIGVACFCIGYMFAKARLAYIDNSPSVVNKIAGTIVINTTDPEKDVIRIELDIPLGEMITYNSLCFNVKIEGPSQ